MNKIVYKIVEGATYTIPSLAENEQVAIFIDHEYFKLQVLGGRVVGANTISGKWLVIYKFKTATELQYIKEIEERNKAIKQLKSDLLEFQRNEDVIEKFKTLLKNNSKFLSQLDNAVETAQRERREIVQMTSRAKDSIRNVAKDMELRIDKIFRDTFLEAEDKKRDIEKGIEEIKKIYQLIHTVTSLIDDFRTYYNINLKEIKDFSHDLIANIDNKAKVAVKKIEEYQDLHRKATYSLNKQKDSHIEQVKKIATKKAKELEKIPNALVVRDTITNKPTKITIINGELDIE